MVLGSTPIVSLEHPVLTCRRLIYLYYDFGGGVLQSTYFELCMGDSWSLIHWLKCPSRLEGALRDITQFGVLCSEIGGANLWCH